MDNYKLLEDEIVLLNDNVKFDSCSGEGELILTNYNLIIKVNYKILFGEDKSDVFVFALDQIKLFDGIPYIKTNDKFAQVFLKNNEFSCQFSNKSKLNEFVDKVNKLITGSTRFERGWKKTKDAIENTIGTETIQQTGEIIKEGILGNIAYHLKVDRKKK